MQIGRLFFTFIFLTAGLNGLAQKAKPAATLSPFAVQEKIYRQALSLNDLEVATNAVFAIIALKPDQIHWQDSLCLLYHGRGMYPQSWKLSDDILKRKPEDPAFREVHAQSLEAIGQYADALKDYERLMQKYKQSVFRYKAAALQYLLKRYGECNLNLDAILTNPATENEKVGLQIESGNNQMQQVPIRAAALNIRGVIAMDMNKKAEAEAAFKEALTLYPEFEMVRQNLDRLQKMP
jgi:tetratricopeptide (TPR) repeat protein